MLDAIGAYERVLKLLTPHLGPSHERVILARTNIAVSMLRHGGVDDLKRSEVELVRAIESTAQLRGRAGGIDARLAVAGWLNVPQMAAALAYCRALQASNVHDVIDAMEIGRARGILDILACNGEGLVSMAQTALERGTWDAKRFSMFEAAYADWLQQTRPDAVDGREPAERSDVSIDAWVTADSVLREFAAELVPFAEPAQASEWESLLRPSDTVLSFSWSPCHVTLAVQSAARDGLSASVAIAADDAATELQERTEDLLRSVSSPGQAGDDLAERATEVLNQLIPSHVREGIRTARRLIVVPDGPLHLLSISCLVELASCEALSGCEIVGYPSLSAMVQLENRQEEAAPTPATHYVGFGSPQESTGEDEHHEFSSGSGTRLVQAETELRQASDHFASSGGITTVLVGEGAVRESLEDALRDCHVLHLATHGVAGSSENPWAAALLVPPAASRSASDNWLPLGELLRSWGRRLDACQLVVLSACESGVGRDRGDSNIALPLGFLHAGARAVVASAWKVNDSATAILMSRMFLNMIIDGLSSSAALAAAQRWLRSLSLREAVRLFPGEIPDDIASMFNVLRQREQEDGTVAAPFAHPVFWAAFTCLGDAVIAPRMQI